MIMNINNTINLNINININVDITINIDIIIIDFPGQDSGAHKRDGPFMNSSYTLADSKAVNWVKMAILMIIEKWKIENASSASHSEVTRTWGRPTANIGFRIQISPSPSPSSPSSSSSPSPSSSSSPSDGDHQTANFWINIDQDTYTCILFVFTKRDKKLKDHPRPRQICLLSELH